jgi:hypothetical protein
MDDIPSTRSSDVDRDAAAEALGEHLAAGRLSFDEFEQRLDQVFDSKTVGELRTALVDLPGTAALALGIASPTERALHRANWDHNRWSRFVAVNAICWSIWAVSMASSGGHGIEGLWPLWVTVPWWLRLASHPGGSRPVGLDGRGRHPELGTSTELI